MNAQPGIGAMNAAVIEFFRLTALIDSLVANRDRTESRFTGCVV